MNTEGWKKRASILESFEVGKRRLDQFVLNGWVRTVKLDPNKTGRRLYSAADVSNTLDDLSRGRTPRRKRVRA